MTHLLHDPLAAQASFPLSTTADLLPWMRLFEALAEPTRLRCVLLLARGERQVRDIARTLDVPQPSLSGHLSLLKAMGLVLSQRDGKRMMYALNDAHEGLRTILNVIEPPAPTQAEPVATANPPTPMFVANSTAPRIHALMIPLACPASAVL